MSEKIHKYFFGQMNAPWKNKSPEEQLSEIRQLLREYFLLRDMRIERKTINVKRLFDIEEMLRNMSGYNKQ